MKRALLPISLGLLLAGCGNQDAGTPRERATVGSGNGEQESSQNRRQDMKSQYPNSSEADRENRAGQAMQSDSRNTPATARQAEAGKAPAERR